MPSLGEGGLEDVGLALGVLLVGLEEDGRLLRLVLRDDGREGARDDGGLRQAVAEDVVAHRGDADGGSARAEHRHAGLLRYRIGRERRAAEGRPDYRRDLVLVDQLVEDADAFLLVRLVVGDDEDELAIPRSLEALISSAASSMPLRIEMP